MDWVRGNLLVKTGFELSHDADATSLLRNQTGTYHYANVENFASDALVFAKYRIAGELNPIDQHNCDQTGKAWRDYGRDAAWLGLPAVLLLLLASYRADKLVLEHERLGYLSTVQWQAGKLLVVS